MIPCFNEADRLDLAAFAAALSEQPSWRLLFVDDGSTDSTAELLESFCASDPERVAVLRLPRNGGKGEAVREGLLEALSEGAEVVGYIDADLSAPLSEFARLEERLVEAGGLDAVLGSRFRRLGSDIQRSEVRHLVGRVYATLASMALGAGIYDTQCGAKVFRAGPWLREALTEPFDERWAFDVELIARLARRSSADPWAAIVEEPLRQWHAVPGSKLRLGSAFKATAELVAIGLRNRRALRSASQRAAVESGKGARGDAMGIGSRR